jgi:hypothetical protein
VTFKWTVEAKAIVAERLKAGDTAREIGERLGVSRSSITGLLDRDIDLAKIGLTRKATGRNGGRIRRFTLEEQMQRKREYNKLYQAKRRSRSNVVQFPGSFQRRPEQQRDTPALRVVSNNIPLMVQDWLDKNGGPRRFEHFATTDTWIIRTYLEERGIKLNGHRGRWAISRGKGRPRIGTWADVMQIADDFRMAEGLQPFCVDARLSKVAGVGRP